VITHARRSRWAQTGVVKAQHIVDSLVAQHIVDKVSGDSADPTAEAPLWPMTAT
jgi:hypothetical protein